MILCTRGLFWIIFANNYKYLIDFTRIIQGFGDSIKLCLDVLDGKTKAVEMRGE